MHMNEEKVLEEFEILCSQSILDDLNLLIELNS